MSFKALKTLKRVYYKYNFNPDVEIVGNPLIEDAVIKSFSLEDYTDISTSYLKNGYEYVIRFKTGDDIRTIQTVFNTNYNLTIDINDGFITSYNQETNLRNIITSCEQNTWYWIKGKIVNNNQKEFWYSEDGQNWSSKITFLDNDLLYGSPIRFGVGCSDSSYNYDTTSEEWIAEQLFTGEIDLYNTYIMYNNELIWHGTLSDESTEDDYDYYKDVEIYNCISDEVRRKYISTQKFQYSSRENIQSWVVPENVHKIHVVCVGGGTPFSYGGYGGKIECDLDVVPNTTLYIVVGYNFGGRYNASDIRTNNNGVRDEESLRSRIIVAGGAGNYGHVSFLSGNNRYSYGGNGGGEIGGSANTLGLDRYTTAATGGTQSEGGKGAISLTGNPSSNLSPEECSGADGSFGIGGKSFIGCSPSSNDKGGDGWYGGGGGSVITRYNPEDGSYTVGKTGSGGGSSYADESVCSNVVHTQGANKNYAGYVEISIANTDESFDYIDEKIIKMFNV